MKIDKLEGVIGEVRDQAAVTEQVGGTGSAQGMRWAADKFETVVHEWLNEALTPTQAGEECVWAPSTIAKKLREGELPQAGRPGAPRVTRGDLLAGPSEAAVPDIIAEVFGLEVGSDG